MISMTDTGSGTDTLAEREPLGVRFLQKPFSLEVGAPDTMARASGMISQRD